MIGYFVKVSGHLLKVVTAGNNRYREAVNTGDISVLPGFPLPFPC